MFKRRLLALGSWSTTAGVLASSLSKLLVEAIDLWPDSKAWAVAYGLVYACILVYAGVVANRAAVLACATFEDTFRRGCDRVHTEV